MFKESRMIGFAVTQGTYNPVTRTIDKGAPIQLSTTPSPMGYVASTPVKTTGRAAPAPAVVPFGQNATKGSAPLNTTTGPGYTSALGTVSVTDPKTGQVHTRNMTAAEEQLHFGSVSPFNQAAIDTGKATAPSQSDFQTLNTNAPQQYGDQPTPQQNVTDLTGANGKGLTGSALLTKQLADLRASGSHGSPAEADLLAKISAQQAVEKQNAQNFQTQQQSGASSAGTTAPTSNAIAGTAAQMQAEAGQRAAARGGTAAQIDAASGGQPIGTPPPVTIPPNNGTGAVPSQTPNGAPPAQTTPNGTTVPPAGTTPPTTIPPTDTTPPPTTLPTPDTSGTTPPPTDTGTTPSTPSLFTADVAAQITSMLGVGGVQSAQTRVDAIQAKIDQGALDQQTGINAIEQVKNDTIAASNTAYANQLDFNNSQDNLNRTAVENAKIYALDTVAKEQAQADLASHIAYHNQEVQNTQTEMFNRRSAAREGLEYSTSGLQYLQTEQQKGIDALTNISQQIAVNDAGFAKDSLKAIRDYTQNTLQASQDALQASNTAWKNHQDAMNSAKSNAASQEVSLRQYTATQKEKYTTELNTIDNNQATLVKDYRGQLMTASTAINRQNLMMTIAGMKIASTEKISGEKLDAMKTALGYKVGQSAIQNYQEAQKTLNAMSQAPTIKAFNAALPFVQNASDALDNALAGKNLLASDFALLTALHKVTLTTGMPRQGLFNEPEQYKSIPDTITGALQKQWQNGSGLSNSDRQAIVDEIQAEVQTAATTAMPDVNNVIQSQKIANGYLPPQYQIKDTGIQPTLLKTTAGQSSNNPFDPNSWSQPQGGSINLSSLGTITQPFGGTYDETHGLAKGPHLATDITFKDPNHIPAFSDGTVTVASGGPLGNHVIITTPDGQTITYGHLASTTLKTGDTVSANDVIGVEGNTGNTNGTKDANGVVHGGEHVHLAIADAKGNAIDPEQYLAANGGAAPTPFASMTPQQQFAFMMLSQPDIAF